MSDKFWNVLRENDIAIKYTQYPLKFDYTKMVNYVQEKGVYVFSAGPEDGIKYFRRIPLNMKSTFNIYHSYVQCPYTDCAQIRDGKLYHCPASAFSYLLNRKIKEMDQVKTCFRISKGDYLDLSEAQKGEDVFTFLSNAVPFCQYCDMDHINAHVEWRTSKKNVEEWVDF